LVRKNSIPFDRQNQSQPHNFMHNKLVVADQIVVTGSFNLSYHAMGNHKATRLVPAKDGARGWSGGSSGMRQSRSYTRNLSSD
jgi:hypothetical protein